MTDELAARRDPDGVAISDVDCTPREPRREGYLSDAQHAAALRRHASGHADLGRDLTALRADVKQRNRTAALRTVLLADGTPGYATQCACKWHSLAVPDAEVARREYDAHACRLTGEIGLTLHRKGDGLGADWAAQAKGELADVVAAPVVTVTTDDTEQRMQLLELK